MRMIDSITEAISVRLKRCSQRVRSIPDNSRCKQLSDQYRIAGDYRRIYFYHIRKTAGTSLCAAFFRLAAPNGEEAMSVLAKRGGRIVLDDKVYVGWNRYLIERGEYFFGFSHFPAHRLRLPNETYTVTCLRDPVRRIISHYKNTKYYEKHHPDQKELQRLDVSSLSNFVATMPKKDLLRQIYMFSKTYTVSEAADRIASCSYYFFTEEYAESLKQLAQRLSVPLEASHENRLPVDVEIDEREIEQLREQMEPEYQLIEQLEQTPTKA